MNCIHISGEEVTELMQENHNNKIISSKAFSGP